MTHDCLNVDVVSIDNKKILAQDNSDSVNLADGPGG